eukprot:3940248-Rhodomonas_salina.1
MSVTEYSRSAYLIAHVSTGHRVGHRRRTVPLLRAKGRSVEAKVGRSQRIAWYKRALSQYGFSICSTVFALDVDSEQH